MKKRTPPTVVVGKTPVPVIGYDLIYVEWVDSTREEGWINIEDFDKDPGECLIVQSIGWVLGEDDQTLFMTSHYGPGGKRETQVHGIMRIPLRCVKLRVLLVAASSVGS